MDLASVIIGASDVFVGLLVVALSVPLIQGRVKRNRWYGVRFAKTLASDENWFAANRYGGRRLVSWSRPVITGGVVALFIPLQQNESLLIVCALLPLVYLIAALQCWLFVRKLR